jgi:hypothetical protein
LLGFFSKGLAYTQEDFLAYCKGKCRLADTLLKLTHTESLKLLLGGGKEGDEEDEHAKSIRTPDGVCRADVLWGFVPAFAREWVRDLLGAQYAGGYATTMQDPREISAAAALSSTLAHDDSLKMLIIPEIFDAVAEWVESLTPLLALMPRTERQKVPILFEYLTRSATVDPNTHLRILKPSARNLIHGIIGQIRGFERLEVPPVLPVRQKGSFNPAETGVWYGFTEHGEKLRDNRDFGDRETCDTGACADTNQAAPTFGTCGKAFVSVTAKGVCMMFFMLCLLHQTLVGFHIIPGSEGRKDAHAAFWQYCPNAPLQFVYDFACGCHEYFSNHESGYFSKTIVQHDIFHGWKHKCSRLFRLQRSRRATSWNSSLAEQWNAFIKPRVKASSAQMTKQHFVFYVAFFAELWNRQKEGRLQKLISVHL